MARNHARILTAIWKDKDWLQLTPPAQRAYMLLLSQPRLSMCGSIDYTPARWAALAAGDTEHDIRDAIAELEAHAFLLVDEDTEEMLVRSFVRHDGILDGPNLVQAMWKAWDAVYSERLQRVVVHEVDGTVAFTPGFGAERGRAASYEPPPKAVEMRQTPFDEPSPKGSAKGSPTPVPGTRSCSLSRSPSVVPTTEPDPTPGGGDVIDAAAHLLAWAEAERRGAEIGNPAGYANSRTAPLRRQHEPTWRRLLETEPRLTARQLADHVLTPPTPPSPADDAARAALAIHEANDRRARGEITCTTCQDTGIVEHPDGTGSQCDCTLRRTA